MVFVMATRFLSFRAQAYPCLELGRPMTETAKSDMRLLLFVMSCVGFGLGVVVGLWNIYDARHSRGGDWAGMPVFGAIVFDWPAALVVAALAFVQRGKRLWLQLVMAAILVGLPFVVSWTLDMQLQMLRR